MVMAASIAIYVEPAAGSQSTVVPLPGEDFAIAGPCYLWHVADVIWREGSRRSMGGVTTNKMVRKSKAAAKPPIEYATLALRCPLCNTEFTSEQPLVSEAEGRDSDLKPRHATVDPLPTLILSCPKCRFTAYQEGFGVRPQDEDDEERARLSWLPGDRPAQRFEMPQESDLEDLRRLIRHGDLTRGVAEGREPYGAERYILGARIHEFLTETQQTLPSDRGTMLRCVYESLALKYRFVNETINAITGTQTKRVHIVGGGSNNALLNQFTADSVGVPVLAGPKEATAIGNLMVQAIGAGIIPDLKAAMPLIKSAFPITTFKPQDTVAWDTAYVRFTKLLK